MKVRAGFVANSSSSTYLILNVRSLRGRDTLATFVEETINEVIRQRFKSLKETPTLDELERIEDLVRCARKTYAHDVIFGTHEFNLGEPGGDDIWDLYVDSPRSGSNDYWEWEFTNYTHAWGNEV